MDDDHDIPGVRETAKVFKTGGSQAVRLPKAFRFEGEEVLIHREGDRVVLEPAPPKPPRTREEIDAWLKAIQMPDFMEEGRDQPPLQERDWSAFDD